jgi:hypothetical protein
MFRNTWDELAIKVVCRAKSEAEKNMLLARLDAAAKKGNKTVKLPTYIMKGY